MTVHRSFLMLSEREFFVRTVGGLPGDTARNGAGIAVFSRCGHDGMVEWLLSFR